MHKLGRKKYKLVMETHIYCVHYFSCYFIVIIVIIGIVVVVIIIVEIDSIVVVFIVFGVVVDS
jgi:hypothetical protein